jgi:hypothetical protein
MGALITLSVTLLLGVLLTLLVQLVWRVRRRHLFRVRRLSQLDASVRLLRDSINSFRDRVQDHLVAEREARESLDRRMRVIEGSVPPPH